MGIIIPPPPPFVPPAQSPQARPELVIVAPQRPVAAETTRAVVGASKGRQGNKAADSDTKRGEDEATSETTHAGAPPQGAPAQSKPRGGKVSIDI